MIVAGVQMNGAPGDKHGKIARAKRLTEEAVAKGAKLVCLHELFSTGYFPTTMDNSNFDLAETSNGETLSEMCGVAKRHSVWLVVPFFEKDEDIQGWYYDTAAVIGPNGHKLGRYRKLHIPLTPLEYEKYYFTPGNLGLPLFQASEIRFGVIICYDRHFPELARMMALKGAHLLIIPTSSTKGEWDYQWIQELVALSVTNSLYIAAVNSVGKQEHKEHFGQSVIVDPLGRIISSLGEEEEGIVVADVEPQEVGRARTKLNHFRDLRPDIYSELFHLYDRHMNAALTSDKPTSSEDIRGEDESES